MWLVAWTLGRTTGSWLPVEEDAVEDAVTEISSVWCDEPWRIAITSSLSNVKMPGVKGLAKSSEKYTNRKATSERRIGCKSTSLRPLARRCPVCRGVPRDTEDERACCNVEFILRCDVGGPALSS